MDTLKTLYKPSLALLTDLYQLTMAYAYWKSGMVDHEAIFNMSFRTNPFGGGFAIACGAGPLADYLEALHFDGEDIAYLAGLAGNDGAPLFDPGFLDCLSGLTLDVDVDAVPEGSVVFGREPLVSVRGPLIQCQLLETPLLNAVNFQTLVATKARRIVMAAQGEPVLEFGLRRAQGIDGALSASRAAYIGGCAATSNVLAGRLFGIPVKGTHAHSWVMCFDDEPAAFKAYAEAMPNNCVFLVDTYDTLQGVRNAIEAGRWLRARGHEMVGIRLDSGDLAWLSIQARRLLDEAGFPDAAIVASNDLDEGIIDSLKRQGATIGVWGVGTRLVTAFDQPALDGVYKLSAVRRPGEAWQYRVKLSEQAQKISTPGVLGLRRYRRGGEAIGDLIYDRTAPPDGVIVMVDPLDMTRRKQLPDDAAATEMLEPLFRGGRRVAAATSLPETRARVDEQLAGFHAGIKRFVNPHTYPVGLEEGLFNRRTELILKARGFQK